MQRRLDAKVQNKLLLSFMKIVAIATIADAVPLTGENRVFASLGLDALRRAVNPGLKALLEVAQISAKRPPTSGEVGFRIAPRINAAGRMDVARDVIELFSVKDPIRARELAAKLDQLNSDRQEEERRILRAVEERFTGDPALCDAYCIVVDGEDWHRGVIGITATRVVERYNRPGSRDLARRRRGVRFRPLHSRVPFARCDRVVQRSFFALRRPLSCLRICHARRERRRIAHAAGCLCPRPAHARGFRSHA